MVVRPGFCQSICLSIKSALKALWKSVLEAPLAWISVLIVVVFFALVTASVFASEDHSVVPVTFAMFVANGILGLVELWRSMKSAPYSLRQVHWVFYLIFFVITPIQQYGLWQWPWACNPSEDQIQFSCALVFMWGATFAGLTSGVGLPGGLTAQNRIATLSRPITYSLPLAAAPVFTVIALLSTCVLVSNVGISNMFLRVESIAEYESKTIALLVNVLTRGFTFVSFALLFLNYRRTRKQLVPVLITGACTILTCFPTALARFNVAAIYLGLALLAFPLFSKKRGLFVLCLLLGFLVAYPVFNVFKYLDGSSTMGEIVSKVFSSLRSDYTSGNYDAFSLFIWAIKYTEAVAYSDGLQLLGALLFFVPRAMWPGKPVPTGDLIFGHYGYAFTDISCPLPCEGYINFGIIGVLLFAIAYGCIVRVLDTRYWEHRFSERHDTPTVTSIYYPFVLSLSFYMLRGALMTTLTVVIGDLLVCICLIVAIAAIRIVESKGAKSGIGSRFNKS